MSARVNTTRASCQAPLTDVPPRPPDPIPEVIPGGGISLLAGAPSIGKTALIATLLRDFRDNQLIFGHQPTPVPAIGFINADRGWAAGAGTWFERVGFGDIPCYSLADDRNFNAKRLRRKFERTDLLVEFIDKLKLPQHSLVVVDPIALFLGGNLLDYDTCAVSCHEIRQHLRDRQITMIATAHSGKLKADKKERYLRLQDQILGSTALFGFTDTQMYLATPQELGKPYHVFLWQSHLAPYESFKLSRDDQGLFVPYTPGLEADESITSPAILALFPDTQVELTFADLTERAAAQAISRPTLHRFLKELLTEGQIEKVARGQYRRRPVS